MNEKPFFTVNEIDIVSPIDFIYRGVLYRANERDLIIVNEIIKNKTFESIDIESIAKDIIFEPIEEMS